MTLEEKYEIGFPILEKLFNLKKEELIELLKDIFEENDSVLEILENKPSVIKTLKDDKADNIAIHFYGSIEINFFGIFYKPEHGSGNYLVRFNKYFKLDI